MSEEELIGNNLKSFGEELFRNIIINSARKAMLDKIEALSKKDLQKELKEHLQKEFELEDKTKKQKEVLDKIKEYCNHKLEMLELQKRNIMQILTPENGYLKTDIEIEMQKYKDILELLEEIE